MESLMGLKVRMGTETWDGMRCGGGRSDEGLKSETHTHPPVFLTKTQATRQCTLHTVWVYTSVLSICKTIIFLITGKAPLSWRAQTKANGKITILKYYGFEQARYIRCTTSWLNSDSPSVSWTKNLKGYSVFVLQSHKQPSDLLNSLHRSIDISITMSVWDGLVDKSAQLSFVKQIQLLCSCQ